MSVAPGWYKDPADPTTQRYWDGEGWLGDPLPADATPPPGPPAAPAPVAGPPTLIPSGPTPTAPPVPSHAPVPTRPTPPPAGPPPVGRPPGPPVPSWQGTLPAPPPGWPGAAVHPVEVRPHGYAQATPGARFSARMIDIAAVIGLNVLVNGWFVYLYLRDFIPYFQEILRRATLGQSTTDVPVPDQLGALQWTILLLGLALWFAYEVPALAGTGQTPGKRLMGIKVMRAESPDKLGFGRAFRRWYPLAMPTLLWVCAGFGLLIQIAGCALVLLNRPVRTALHDRYAHTVVVHVGHPKRSPAGATDKESP